MALGDCWFTNALSGLGDWTYPGPAGAFQSPAVAGVVDGGIYLYRAQTFDQTRWEIGIGTYTASTGVFTRTTVLFNSAGTTAKINFPTPPHIVIREAIGQIAGTATNDNASAGNVGEYVESVIPVGSKVALVSGTPKTITFIPLGAGDWEVDVMGYILPAAGTTTTIALLSMSGTTNALDLTPGKFNALVTSASTFTGGNEIGLAIPPYRFALPAPANVFLVAQSNFSVGSSAAYGLIRARRPR